MLDSPDLPAIQLALDSVVAAGLPQTLVRSCGLLGVELAGTTRALLCPPSVIVSLSRLQKVTLKRVASVLRALLRIVVIPSDPVHPGTPLAAWRTKLEGVTV